MPTNIPHNMNEKLYNTVFMTIIKSLKPENIKHMITCNSLEYINESNYLYGLILLNYGATFKNNETKIKFISRIKDNYAKTFYESEKLNKVIESEYPVGQKLKSIVPLTCPITLVDIVDPVILEDGTIYSKEAILEWLTVSNVSPLSGIKLNKYWNMYDINANEIIYPKYFE